MTTAPSINAEQGDPRPRYPDITDTLFWDAYFTWRDASLLSVERFHALYLALRHITATGVPGALLECGVYRGGSACFCAAVLAALGQADRDLFWCDTFRGFPDGVEEASLTGETLQAFPKDDVLPMAMANFARTGYPAQRLHVLRGPVQDTIPGGPLPDAIALLHLDTDDAPSVLHELTHLYPRLSPGGVLCIDDYGHFPGVGRAVDAYFADLARAGTTPPLLARTDYTGRMGVKPRA
ncbi:class I SAM-dependent methyltransferase [Nitratidesulfovibrio sp. HK-II]|uniref:TylF/MycF/NovP-related O-methyltransferase n=1 Tax=Nitratidesulfovibrio sp. HK-II TaxID=2009266 RepID=UPI000E2F6750|nr:TylF/MycF/NovP-related O-methyltransferase [Nitratidesulfovibrio sp. HK-II]GBO97699.1 macrocin-O-methyltransferase [Nitratidesulfovibrio sp. HK-II]